LPDTFSHTEEVARTKWCPFARVGLDWHVNGSAAHFAANRNNDGQPIGVCIASTCMAWRWNDYEQTEGFCGLAGRPPSGPNT